MADHPNLGDQRLKVRLADRGVAIFKQLLVEPERDRVTRFVDLLGARFYNLITPAGFEGFFRALSEPAPRRELPPPLGGPPDIARIKKVAAEYGCEVLI